MTQKAKIKNIDFHTSGQSITRANAQILKLRDVLYNEVDANKQSNINLYRNNYRKVEQKWLKSTSICTQSRRERILAEKCELREKYLTFTLNFILLTQLSDYKLLKVF